MGRIGSFHLVHDGRTARNLARLGTDRRALVRVDGLRFWRLLGTGSGSTTSPSADLRRRALFAVWESPDALDAFLATSPVAARWAAAEELWSVRLRRLGGHGRWRGVDPLEGMEQGRSDGPVAVVTRADVRLRHWRTFARAGRPVDGELHGADGLVAVVGVGEAPIGRQATFSLWRSAADLRRFAFELPEHARVVQRTRGEGWYGEELFARFEPYASEGRWRGIDPLAGLRPG
jgi:heme-degrading monooxygenase HmoA